MSCTAAKTGKQRFVKSRTPSTRRPASGSVALAGPRLRLDLRPYESFGQEPVAVDGTVLVYAATVTFEEILDARVTSEELREEA